MQFCVLFDYETIVYRYLSLLIALNIMIDEETCGARFILRNSALDELIKGSRPFQNEIDSQIHHYGRAETLKVVEFLASYINRSLSVEYAENNTTFTKEQIDFLLAKNGNLTQVRQDLNTAYSKCLIT